MNALLIKRLMSAIVNSREDCRAKARSIRTICSELQANPSECDSLRTRHPLLSYVQRLAAEDKAAVRDENDYLWRRLELTGRNYIAPTQALLQYGIDVGKIRSIVEVG